MGILVHERSGRVISLGHRTIFGRGRRADVRLDDATISSEHACLYWMHGAWKARDLGSRNGTRVEERPLQIASPENLRRGARLRFGASDEVWVLSEVTPPGPSARGVDGRMSGDGYALWLPNREEPDWVIVRSEEKWILEDAGGAHEVEDGHAIECGGVSWILELPPLSVDDPERTASTLVAEEPGRISLEFTVSRNEEHVALDAVVGQSRVSLGARAHNYPLLILHRLREQARREAVSAEEIGWIYVDELSRQLRVDRKTLNLQLWRARQHLMSQGIRVDLLVERRADAREIRLGPVTSSERKA